MDNSIVPNILFDDLYDLKKYQRLEMHSLFINMLNNSDKDKILDKKFSERYFFKNETNTNFLNDELIDKHNNIHNSPMFNNSNFEEVFLKLAIKNIPSFYSYSVKKFIREKGIYSKSAKVGFYSNEKDRLLQAIDALQDSKHLTEDIILLATEEAYKCIDLIDKYRRLNEIEHDKIPFSLKKVELLLLFSKLHDVGIIKGLTPVQLFQRMEAYFTYENNQPLTNLYKAHQEYRSGRKKSKSALQTLAIKIAKAIPLS